MLDNKIATQPRAGPPLTGVTTALKSGTLVEYTFALDVALSLARREQKGSRYAEGFFALDLALWVMGPRIHRGCPLPVGPPPLLY